MFLAIAAAGIGASSMPISLQGMRAISSFSTYQVWAQNSAHPISALDIALGILSGQTAVFRKRNLGRNGKSRGLRNAKKGLHQKNIINKLVHFQRPETQASLSQTLVDHRSFSSALYDHKEML